MLRPPLSRAANSVCGALSIRHYGFRDTYLCRPHLTLEIKGRTTLLFPKHIRRVHMQSTAYRASDSEQAAEEGREGNRSKNERILRSRLKHDVSQHATRSDTEEQSNQRAARQQDQHAPKGGCENLSRLSAQRDANAEFAGPLADCIRRKAKGSGDGEQQSKSAEQTERDGSHLRREETHRQQASPLTRCHDGNSGIKIVQNFADAGYRIADNRSARVGLDANDQRGAGSWPLRHGKVRCGPRRFTGQELFAVARDAHDLDRHTGAVFEVAAYGILRVKKAPGELLIH